MPLFEFRCPVCDDTFETLVKTPAEARCPSCGAIAGLERLASALAPRMRSRALVKTARARAAREGHFSYYSEAERSKLYRAQRPSRGT
ncbi:MAG: zinc ribbon domain-containing protein [Myxococcales bacterium]|nr:zinc ribbon domain-containing protein [Myxococcales bacterium]